MEMLLHHLAKTWIAYVMFGGFLWFVVYVYVHTRSEKAKSDLQEKVKENKQK